MAIQRGCARSFRMLACFSLPDGGHRKTNDEGRSHPFTRTLRADGAAMKFNEMLYDGETKPKPTITPCGRSVALPKSFENGWQEFRFNASPRIMDRDLKMRVHALQKHIDASTLGREFDGIGQKI